MKMKTGIDVLLVILLVVLVGSFAAIIINGEVWQIRPLSTDTSVTVETLDYGRSVTAFISSCICVASGASMLYITAKRFPREEKVKQAEDSSAKL